MFPASRRSRRTLGRRRRRRRGIGTYKISVMDGVPQLPFRSPSECAPDVGTHHADASSLRVALVAATSRNVERPASTTRASSATVPRTETSVAKETRSARLPSTLYTASANGLPSGVKASSPPSPNAPESPMRHSANAGMRSRSIGFHAHATVPRGGTITASASTLSGSSALRTTASEAPRRTRTPAISTANTGFGLKISSASGAPSTAYAISVTTRLLLWRSSSMHAASTHA